MSASTIVQNHRSLDNQRDKMIGDNFCVHGHDLKLLLVDGLFNCVAKHFVKELTNVASQYGQQTK